MSNNQTAAPLRSRSVIYVAVYLLLLQFALPRAIPTEWIYRHRVDYEMAKPNMAGNLSLAMDRIAREITENPGQDYIFLLGDSVTYSGPGGADQSIGYFLEQWLSAHGQSVRVYNLAEPAMLGADTYTTVLMLKEHGIPLKRVVLNQLYSDFYPHPESVALFSWMGDALKARDPEAWTIAHGPAAAPTPWTAQLRQFLLRPVSLWQYKDVLRARLEQSLPIKSASGEVKDTRPWTAKREWLLSLMQDPVYQRLVDPRPLNLTDSAPQVQILTRMFREMEGADILVWLSPLNQELMAQWAQTPEYRANLQRLDAWFATQPVRYVNLESTMASDKFTDNVHMTPEGYRDLAAVLGQQLLAAPAR